MQSCQRSPYDHYLPHLRRKAAPPRQRKATYSLCTIEPRPPSLRQRKVLSIAHLDPHHLDSPPKPPKQCRVKQNSRARTLQDCRREVSPREQRIKNCIDFMKGVLSDIQSNRLKPRGESPEKKRQETGRRSSKEPLSNRRRSRDENLKGEEATQKGFGSNRKITLQAHNGKQKRTLDHYIRSHAKLHSGKALLLKRGASNSIIHFTGVPLDPHPQRYPNKNNLRENSKSLCLHLPNQPQSAYTQRRQSCVPTAREGDNWPIVEEADPPSSDKGPVDISAGPGQVPALEVAVGEEGPGVEDILCSPIGAVNESSFLSGAGREQLMRGMWGQPVRKTMKISSKKIKLAFPSGFFQSRH